MQSHYYTVLCLFISQTIAANSLIPADLQIGLAVSAQSSPFKDGDAVISVMPTTVQQNERFQIPGLSLPLRTSADVEWFIGAGLDDWDYKRGDSDFVAGMNDLDRALNLRFGTAWLMNNSSWAAEIDKELTAHHAIQAKIRATTNPYHLKQTKVRPYAELQWLSERMTDYYVGVDADEATTTRPAYAAGATWGLKTGVTLEHPLTPRLTLVGGVDVSGYDKQVTDSPIVDGKPIWESYVGAAYRW